MIFLEEQHFWQLLPIPLHLFQRQNSMFTNSSKNSFTLFANISKLYDIGSARNLLQKMILPGWDIAGLHIFRQAGFRTFQWLREWIFRCTHHVFSTDSSGVNDVLSGDFGICSHWVVKPVKFSWAWNSLWCYLVNLKLSDNCKFLMQVTPDKEFSWHWTLYKGHQY